jgi:dihydroxyacetone kinase-like protein
MPLTNTDIIRWLQRSAQVLHENSSYLTQLDSAIGDADHGINMDRGFSAVAAKLASMENADISTLLRTTGTTLVSTVGGASGPLYGTAFLRAASATANKQVLESADVLAMFSAALEGIKARGKAQPGEKTMIDTLTPAIEAGQRAQTDNANLSDVLSTMVSAAEEGMKKTIEMTATKGRASYLGERSVGHQDPGATSSWLLLKALADTAADR